MPGTAPSPPTPLPRVEEGKLAKKSGAFWGILQWKAESGLRIAETKAGRKRPGAAVFG